MPNETLQDLVAQAEALLHKGRALQAQKKEQKIKELTDRLEAASTALDWHTRTEPYRLFKEAESVVLAKKSEIDRDGVKATCQLTGREFAIQLNDDRSYLTFSDGLREGMTLEIRGTSYFVISHTFSYAGSTGQLMAALTDATIAAPGTKSTPYSAVPCIFDHKTLKRTVPRRNAIASDQIVTISGVKYAPVQTYLTSINHAFISYELAPAGEPKK